MDEHRQRERFDDSNVRPLLCGLQDVILRKYLKNKEISDIGNSANPLICIRNLKMSRVCGKCSLCCKLLSIEDDPSPSGVGRLVGLG
jgi:hypothetical protein